MTKYNVLTPCLLVSIAVLESGCPVGSRVIGDGPIGECEAPWGEAPSATPGVPGGRSLTFAANPTPGPAAGLGDAFGCASFCDVVFACDPDPAGCAVTFSDPEFATAGRDALYYVRAIEAPSLAVAADPLSCTRDEQGRCMAVDVCDDRPDDDDCLGETEERAWSSPIFVEHAG